MNKSKIFGLWLLVSFIFITSCSQDLAFPQKFQIKTEANYNFTLANIEQDFSDKVSAKAIVDKISQPANPGESLPFEFYDYNPGGKQNVQQFLIRMPLQEVPLDFASYMENIDIGKGMDAMSFEQNITVPDISIAESQELALDDLNAAIAAAMTITGITTGDGMPKSINFANFNSVILQYGKMTIQTSATGKVYLYSVTGLTSAAEVMTTAPIAEGTIVDGKVELDLSGKTLYGGSTGTWIRFDTAPAGYEFLGTMGSGTKVSKASGVTVPEMPEVNIEEMTFPVGTGDNALVSCEFTGGSTICLELNTPATWGNVGLERDVTLSGGLDINFSGTDPIVSLDGKKFTNQDIKAKGKIKLILNNATIDFSSKPSIAIATEIKGISQLTAKTPDSLQTKIDVNTALPETAISMVKTIKWNAGTGIKVKYINTFPAGNDFSLNDVKSSFIGLGTSTPLQGTISSGTATEREVSFVTTEATTSTIVEDQKVDFKAELVLPNYDSTEKTFTVTSVVPGETYKIKIEVLPVFDWDKITLNMDSISDPITGDIPLSINPSNMLTAVDNALGLTGSDILSDKLKLSSLKIHLFCEKPGISLFQNASFGGKVFFDDEANQKYLLGSSSATETMPFAKEPQLIKDEEGTVISTVSGGKDVDLADFINAAAAETDLKLKYSLGLSTGNNGDFTISKADLENVENTSMKITAMVVIPFAFRFDTNGTGYYDLDIMKLMQKEFNAGDPDMLGRTEPSANGEPGSLDSFMEIIESVTISYESSKKPIISDNDLQLVFDLDGNDPAHGPSVFDEKKLSISSGSYTESPQKILQNLIYPSVSLRIKDGNISIPREMAFKTRIDLSIKTNGEPLTLGGN